MQGGGLRKSASLQRKRRREVLAIYCFSTSARQYIANNSQQLVRLLGSEALALSQPKTRQNASENVTVVILW